MALFPGPQWNADQIAAGLLRAEFTGWSVRTMGAIVMAESLGYVYAHGVNQEASGTPSTSPAYLAEGHGLAGMDDYWIMRTWRYRSSPATEGHRLMGPYWEGTKSFSQLAKDPDWNLQMARQVFLLRALTHGWTGGYTAWTSYNHNRHQPFMPAALDAAHKIGAIP